MVNLLSRKTAIGHIILNIFLFGINVGCITIVEDITFNLIAIMINLIAIGGCGTILIKQKKEEKK